jgi:hypothetical protein
VPHQAKAALQSFFSLNNLTALRELAMQTAASHVEGDLQLQWQAAGKTTLPLRGKLMVCLGDQHGSALVRYGHRFAQRRQPDPREEVLLHWWQRHHGGGLVTRGRRGQRHAEHGDDGPRDQ